MNKNSTTMMATGFFVATCFQLLLPDTGFTFTPPPLSSAEQSWQKISAHFQIPEKWEESPSEDLSPLLFKDGTKVNSVQGWKKRKAEIQTDWQNLLGKWPRLMTDQKLEILDSVKRENFVQHRVQFEWIPGQQTTGYLLIPQGNFKPMPAVISVYYEPESGIGKGAELRDFAYQLTKRGFVTLSLGTTKASAAKTYSLYYPNLEKATVQPLSMLACAAANAWHALANQKQVDENRIGIVGHSFGGKWAMFSSCLFDKFAAAAWSDPGIMFQADRGSINYWEPWYLGYHPKPWRKRGLITPDNPARGLYPKLIEQKRNLHELHALMAPRPFLVSGGAEDPPSRWAALKHSIEVNEVLGYKNRVGMTNRPKHGPTVESNAAIYNFFEHFLMHEKPNTKK